MATSTNEQIRILDRLHKRLRETMKEPLTPELLKVLEEESTVLAERLDELVGQTPPETTAAKYDRWVQGFFCREVARG